MPHLSIYVATKAAVVSMARTISGELIGRGVRVNAVSPGTVATPRHHKAGLIGDNLAALVRQIPLGRRGEPEEIAQAIVFLEFVIDGG